jgi:hypothetical protein
MKEPMTKQKDGWIHDFNAGPRKLSKWIAYNI